jgi:hypothetical protein
MSCEGAFVKLSTDDGAENSSRTPDNPTNASPHFTLPDWTRRIVGRLRPAPEDEDIAPDEMPELSGRDSLASLTHKHIKDNVVTAQLANINGVAQNTYVNSLSSCKDFDCILILIAHTVLPTSCRAQLLRLLCNVFRPNGNSPATQNKHRIAANTWLFQ